MFENFREFLQNHTYLKAVKKSTREMLMHTIHGKNYKKKLAHDLNIKQMWCLYVKECKKEDLMYVKQAKYGEVLCNYSFFKHKKDQCSMCERYNWGKKTGIVDKSL